MTKKSKKTLRQAKKLQAVQPLMQWEYTKQDDTGAAKGTVVSKITPAKSAP